jgi:zinc D-Ala-D-Ala carboxypeptidase
MIRGPFSAEAAEAFWDEDRWPNFSIKELVCKCGCGEVLWDEDVLDDAQAIRNELGHGLTLSSATRCRIHNNAVSSTGDTGPHTKGALDLAVMGGTAVQVITMASGRGVTGIEPKNVLYVSGKENSTSQAYIEIIDKVLVMFDATGTMAFPGQEIRAGAQANIAGGVTDVISDIGTAIINPAGSVLP